MAFGVHTLNVGIIVIFLGGVCGALAFRCAYHRPRNQTAAGADRGSCAAAESGTCRCSDCAANDSAAHLAVGGGLIGSHTADLAISILPAVVIVRPKLVKRHSGAGQYHDAGAGWHMRTSAEQGDQGRYDNFQFLFHISPHVIAEGPEKLGANLVDMR